MELAESAEAEARTEIAVILGVDTHQDTHVAVILDGLGKQLGTLSVSANTAGYRSPADFEEDRLKEVGAASYLAPSDAHLDAVTA